MLQNEKSIHEYSTKDGLPVESVRKGTQKVSSQLDLESDEIPENACKITLGMTLN